MPGVQETTSPSDDDVVISGMSGRFPESDDIWEFHDNLMNGVDMVNDEPRRWPNGIYGLPSRSGKLKDLSKFDAVFFGVSPKQAEVMDPQLRILHEVVYETILDSGLNPQNLRGSRTGVFVAVTGSESTEFWSHEDRVNGYGLLGGSRCMVSNRISFAFDLNGPSVAVDTACSSSLTAIHAAHRAIKNGDCDRAIVAGANIMLKPTYSVEFLKLGALGSEGKCKVFDASAGGYVRSEAVVSLMLQKSSEAKRNYASIVGVKINTDGAKEEGITYPSGKMQRKLLEDVYTNLDIDPTQVSYMEAHGTGTKVGDPEESNSIAEVLCQQREGPLLIGSIKSNMGHAEATSGLCSIVKVILAMETGRIPANLHFSQPNPEIPPLFDNRLKVVTENLPWEGGYAAINSFGMGGVNTHLVLKSNSSEKRSIQSENTVPQLVLTSGTSRAAIDYLFKKLDSIPSNGPFIDLLRDIYKTNIPGHLYRGYSIIGNEAKREIQELRVKDRETWFVFSGMGSQWVGMGKPLMVFEPFSNAIKKCAAALMPHGIDLMHLMYNAQEKDFDENIINTFVSIAANQVALIDLLTSLGITPDGMIGHSVGELACSYADGGFTAEQTVLAAYWRGHSVKVCNHSPGLMASVGLTWEETVARLPEGVEAACHNGKDNVTVSGPRESVERFVETIKSENKFAKAVNTSGIAFHSKYIRHVGVQMEGKLKELIPNPKPRTPRWKSSSVVEEEWSPETIGHCSADYHVTNLISPVLFYRVLKFIPENAVVIEIAPHSLLQAILKRDLPKSCINIGLTMRDTGVDYFLSSIGKMYNAGLKPNLDILYPMSCLPVPRGTPQISPLIKWDHSVDWQVPNFCAVSKSAKSVVEVNINSEEYKYINGHVIDGRLLFPATGYLVLVWKVFAKLKQQSFDSMIVTVEDFQIKRATVMPKDDSVKFQVNIFDGSGHFELVESDSVVATGRIECTPDEKPLQLEQEASNGDHLPLNRKDVYTHLRLRGYNYDGIFRGIRLVDNEGINGELDWNNNWVCFIDTMLQFMLGLESDELNLPVRIQKILIDAPKHLETVSQTHPDKGVPVYNDRFVGVVQSGGIEIRGMDYVMATRRPHQRTRLEKAVFVPYECQEGFDEETAQRIMLDIICENNLGPKPITIVELAEKTKPEDLLVKKMTSLMEAAPFSEFKVFVASSNPKVDYTDDDLDINWLNKDLHRKPLDKEVDCFIVPFIMDSIFKNIYASLKPGGFVMVETLNRPSYDVDDDDFVLISSIPSGLKTYLLLRKRDNTEKKYSVVRVTNNKLDWLEELKSSVLKQSKDETLLIVSNGEPDCGVSGLFNCLRFEPLNGKIRCFFMPDEDDEFSLLHPEIADQLKKGLVVNTLKYGLWGSSHHLPLDQSEEVHQVEHAVVAVGLRGDLTSLKWTQGPISFYRPQNYPNRKFCTVYYSSLNFKDIMIASGKLQVFQDSVLGVEFSGRDSEGQRVMGIVPSMGLATSVLALPDFLWRVPDDWTLEEAATVPVVYTTSYYALLVKGQLCPGESVLIHAGSGGVGQAAIAIALHMGCKVFTTVGSKEKREFIKKMFPQLTDRQIGNSRDSSFEQLIRRETRGRGVDVILNSLSQEQLKASVRCLAKDGRFLEIGKYDLLNNTPLGLKVLLDNTSVQGIFVDALVKDDGKLKDKIEVFNLVQKGIESGVVKPLPRTVFSSEQVEESFRFMAGGKHIGKILIKIRDEEALNQSPQKILMPALKRTYMNPDKTYIITGGLGGFGLELANWLLSRGARNLILLSRSGVTTGYQSLRMRKWAKEGFNVVVSTSDISKEASVRNIIKEANDIAPVGGIFLLAGVLRDNLIEKQSEDQFREVFNSKILSAKAFDTVSREDCPRLDHFVTFSSVISSRGGAGQTNYGMANAAMDRICEIRRSHGLPAVSMQWGGIADVGIIINRLDRSEGTVVAGSIPQKMPSCLAAVDYFLQLPYPVVQSTVDAKKKTKRGESRNQSKTLLMEAIANILGMKDYKTVNEVVTLSDMGMDSLMLAEVKQTMEVSYDLILTTQDIRTLTFGKLKEMASSDAASTQEKEVPRELNNGQVNEFKEEKLIPREKLVKLREGIDEKERSRRLILIPPVEGTVSCLAQVASQIPATVLGLQATQDVPTSSIKDMAAHYVKELKLIQPHGPYVICGYSYGTCINFEMSLMLKAMGDEAQLVMIDGTPLGFRDIHHRMLRRWGGDRDRGSREAVNIALFVSLFIPVDNNKLIPEMKLLPDFESRIKLSVDMVKKVTKFSDEEISNAARLFFLKIVSLQDYEPSGVTDSPVVLVKASDNQLNEEHDYGLGSLCSKPAQVFTVKGDHRSIVTGDTAKEIADIITSTIFVG